MGSHRRKPVERSERPWQGRTKQETFGYRVTTAQEYMYCFNTIAPAVIAKKRRRIIEVFKNAGATTPETARTLAELGLSDSGVLQIQMRRRVLVEVDSGRYYLDVEREEQVSQTRRNVAIIALLAVFVLLLLGWYFGWTGP